MKSINPSLTNRNKIWLTALILDIGPSDSRRSIATWYIAPCILGSTASENSARSSRNDSASDNEAAEPVGEMDLKDGTVTVPSSAQGVTGRSGCTTRCIKCNSVSSWVWEVTSWQNRDDVTRSAKDIGVYMFNETSQCTCERLNISTVVGPRHNLECLGVSHLTRYDHLPVIVSSSLKPV